MIKPTSAAAKKAQATVNTLLAGIPQQGNTLGSPTAKVTDHRVRRPGVPRLPRRSRSEPRTC